MLYNTIWSMLRPQVVTQTSQRPADLLFEYLVARMSVTAGRITDMLRNFQKVRNSRRYRCQACLDDFCSSVLFRSTTFQPLFLVLLIYCSFYSFSLLHCSSVASGLSFFNSDFLIGTSFFNSKTPFIFALINTLFNNENFIIFKKISIKKSDKKKQPTGNIVFYHNSQIWHFGSCIVILSHLYAPYTSCKLFGLVVGLDALKLIS